MSQEGDMVFVILMPGKLFFVRYAETYLLSLVDTLPLKDKDEKSVFFSGVENRHIYMRLNGGSYEAKDWPSGK